MGICCSIFNFGKKLQPFNSGSFRVSLEVVEFPIQEIKIMLNGYSLLAKIRKNNLHGCAIRLKILDLVQDHLPISRFYGGFSAGGGRYPIPVPKQ